jgi:hypothetical protein
MTNLRRRSGNPGLNCLCGRDAAMATEAIPCWKAERSVQSSELMRGIGIEARLFGLKSWPVYEAEMVFRDEHRRPPAGPNRSTQRRRAIGPLSACSRRFKIRAFPDYLGQGVQRGSARAQSL